MTNEAQRVYYRNKMRKYRERKGGEQADKTSKPPETDEEKAARESAETQASALKVLRKAESELEGLGVLDGNGNQMPPILEASPAFRAVWDEWKKHRKEKRKPLTPTSVNRQLKELAGWGPDRAIAAIQHSITKGWTGIFEPGAATPSPGVEPDHKNGF
jgi:hypothetical protein